MNRYLLSISYIGTRFRGIQKTVNKLDEPRLDTNTIQGSIELALRVFRPVNEIQTVLSSRTDSGVHALHTTLHVDLQRKSSEPYDTTILTGVLNRTLHKQELPIRILNARIVPNSFHCRYNALGRTYLYRIAVANSKQSSEAFPLKNRNFEAFLPVEELDRCFFIQDATFDIERLRQASHMFLGKHDFRTFMSMSRQSNPMRSHPRFTLRSIDEINIRPGRSVAIGGNVQRAEELYNYWEIEIKGKSFLYKQVRRIVGALVSLATGRINEKCIYEMITIPSKHSWESCILLAPACGLYLHEVHYDEQDLQIPDSTNNLLTK